MECVPTVRVVVVKVATAAPLTVARATVAITVAPSLNCTLPAGISGPGQLTVAVKVTGVPLVEGLAEEEIAVDVAALFTVCVKVPLLGA